MSAYALSGWLLAVCKHFLIKEKRDANCEWVGTKIKIELKKFERSGEFERKQNGSCSLKMKNIKQIDS